MENVLIGKVGGARMETADIARIIVAVPMALLLIALLILLIVHIKNM